MKTDSCDRLRSWFCRGLGPLLGEWARNRSKLLLSELAIGVLVQQRHPMPEKLHMFFFGKKPSWIDIGIQWINHEMSPWIIRRPHFRTYRIHMFVFTCLHIYILIIYIYILIIYIYSCSMLFLYIYIYIRSYIHNRYIYIYDNMSLLSAAFIRRKKNPRNGPRALQNSLSRESQRLCPWKNRGFIILLMLRMEWGNDNPSINYDWYNGIIN